MSLNIDHIILHQLIKRDEQTLEMVLRDSPLEANAATEAMVEELHRIYTGKSKAFGLFNQESAFAEALKNNRRGEQTF